MAVLARGSISLSNIVESAVVSTVWYYYLQPSTSNPPSQPADNTPLPSGWTTTEPAYTEGSTNDLYVLVKTTYSTGDYTYTDVSLSSSYAASKQAYSKALTADGKATNAQSTAETANANALQAGQPNISPFYSRVPYVVGDYWTLWNATLNNQLILTPLNDGWVHVKFDNRTGGSQLRCDHIMVKSNLVGEGSDYTFLFEVKNNVSTGTSDFYIVQTDNSQFWGSGIKKNLEGNKDTSTSITFADSNVGRDGTVYYKRFVKTSEATGSTHWTGTVSRLCSFTFRINAGAYMEFDIRVSMYDGEYWGPYKPYVDYGLREEFENLGVGGRNLLLGTVDPVETTIAFGANNYMTVDAYKTVAPIPQLFTEGDYLTISFDWETTATEGFFRVEGGTVTPYVWGSVVKATGGRSPNTQYIDFASDNTSGHFEIVYKVTSAVAAASASLQWLRIRIDGAATSGKTFKISNAKCERGKNASDWTPAPEDVDANIEAAVDGISVGGRNLFGYGSKCESLDGLNNGGFNIVTEDGYTCAHVVGELTKDKNLRSKIPFTPKPNEVVTISAWVKIKNIVLGTGTPTPMCGFYLSGQTIDGGWRQQSAVASYLDGVKGPAINASNFFPDLITDENWHKVAYVGVFSNYNFTANLLAGVYLRNATGDLYVREIKYERGNKPTDWTPAPEDIDTSIAELQPELIVGTHGTTATASWTGTSTTLTELKVGTRIQYKLSSAGASNVTLTLILKDGTTTGAIPVYYNNTTRLNSQYGINAVVDLIYDGSAWRVLNPYKNDNYYDRTQYKASVTAVGAIDAGRIGVFNSEGKLMKLDTTPFDTSYPILYVATKYTATALTQTGNYTFWGTAFSLANTKSGFTGTAGKPVYIVGTLNGKMFTPDAAIFTTTEPTTEDGKYYIRLGLMSTTTNAVLEAEHPIFRYFGGAFRRHADAAQTAANGKNAVYYSTTEPTGTHKEGDTWFQLDSNGQVIMIKQYNGSTWADRLIDEGAMNTLAVANAIIGYLDVYSLTAAELSALSAVLQTIRSRDGKSYWDLTTGEFSTENGYFKGTVEASLIKGDGIKTETRAAKSFAFNPNGSSTTDNQYDVPDDLTYNVFRARGIQTYGEGVSTPRAQIIPAIDATYLSSNYEKYGWFLTHYLYTNRFYNYSGRIPSFKEAENLVFGVTNTIHDRDAADAETVVTGVTGLYAYPGLVTLRFTNFSFAADTGTSANTYRIKDGYRPIVEQDLVSTINQVRFRITTDGYIRPYTVPTSATAIRGTFMYMTTVESLSPTWLSNYDYTNYIIASPNE